MRFFNAAMNMAIKAKAGAKAEWMLYQSAGIEVDSTELYNKHLGFQMDTFHKALEICETLQASVCDKLNSFVVTISPKHTVVITDFAVVCMKFAQSKMFTHYAFAFEQKGETEDQLGMHMHCHFVVATTYAKSHVLKKCFSLFESMCDPSGIQVDKASRPEAFVNTYLLKHEGREGSSNAKTLTKDTDAQWRSLNNLQTLYVSDGAYDQFNIQRSMLTSPSTSTITEC